jgi:hypothetical protein
MVNAIHASTIQGSDRLRRPVPALWPTIVHLQAAAYFVKAVKASAGAETAKDDNGFTIQINARIRTPSEMNENG